MDNSRTIRVFPSSGNEVLEIVQWASESSHLSSSSSSLFPLPSSSIRDSLSAILSILKVCLRNHSRSMDMLRRKSAQASAFDLFDLPDSKSSVQFNDHSHLNDSKLWNLIEKHVTDTDLDAVQDKLDFSAHPEDKVVGCIRLMQEVFHTRCLNVISLLPPFFMVRLAARRQLLF